MSKREAIIFGPAAAAIRKSRGLGQTALARRSGVAEGTIAPLEIGRRQPSRETLDALAAPLNVPVEAIGLYLPDVLDPELVDAFIKSPIDGLVKILLELVQYTRDEVAADAAEKVA